MSIIYCPQGHKHRTVKGVEYCNIKTEFLKHIDTLLNTPHTDDGTKEDLMDFGEFRDIFWGWIVAYIKKRDGNRCLECGATQRLEVHHIIPRSHGGGDHPVNLKTLCHDCHWEYHRIRPNKIVFLPHRFIPPPGQLTLDTGLECDGFEDIEYDRAKELIIDYLKDNKIASLSELAETLRINLSLLCEIIRELVENGLIKESRVG